MTYNIGAPEDHSHSSKAKQKSFKDKLAFEIGFLCDKFHVILIQEIALQWSMVLGSVLPSGWTFRWGTGAYATVWREIDWATHPAALQEECYMFPDNADRENAHRQWRTFMKAGL